VFCLCSSATSDLVIPCFSFYLQNEVTQCDICKCDISSRKYAKHVETHNRVSVPAEVEQIEEAEVGATGRTRRTAAKKYSVLVKFHYKLVLSLCGT